MTGLYVTFDIEEKSGPYIIKRRRRKPVLAAVNYTIFRIVPYILRSWENEYLTFPFFKLPSRFTSLNFVHGVASKSSNHPHGSLTSLPRSLLSREFFLLLIYVRWKKKKKHDYLLSL